MEHTLGEKTKNMEKKEFRLNPCFSGTYSRSAKKGDTAPGKCRLNPCFSGTYSRSRLIELVQCDAFSLNPCFSGTYSRRLTTRTKRLLFACLNPCFSGTYSRSKLYKMLPDFVAVLILVLVEHTLGAVFLRLSLVRHIVLILVLVEHTLGVCPPSSLQSND